MIDGTIEQTFGGDQQFVLPIGIPVGEARCRRFGEGHQQLRFTEPRLVIAAQITQHHHFAIAAADHQILVTIEIDVGNRRHRGTSDSSQPLPVAAETELALVKKQPHAAVSRTDQQVRLIIVVPVNQAEAGPGRLRQRQWLFGGEDDLALTRQFIAQFEFVLQLPRIKVDRAISLAQQQIFDPIKIDVDQLSGQQRAGAELFSGDRQGAEIQFGRQLGRAQLGVHFAAGIGSHFDRLQDRFKPGLLDHHLVAPLGQVTQLQGSLADILPGIIMIPAQIDLGTRHRRGHRQH